MIGIGQLRDPNPTMSKLGSEEEVRASESGSFVEVEPPKGPLLSAQKRGSIVVRLPKNGCFKKGEFPVSEMDPHDSEMDRFLLRSMKAPIPALSSNFDRRVLRAVNRNSGQTISLDAVHIQPER
jgi:hypothetical protein